MAPFSPGTAIQSAVLLLITKLQGVFPFGEYVSGIWASLMAGKWHRRGEWRGLLVRDDVDFGGTIHDRCNNLALVVGIS